MAVDGGAGLVDLQRHCGRLAGKGLGRALAHPAAQRGAGLGHVALRLVAAVGQGQGFLAGHQLVGRHGLATGDPRVQRLQQQLVLALQLAQLGQLAFGKVHAQPRQPGVALDAQTGDHQHGLLARGLGLGTCGAGLALGGVGQVLHHSDALHGHAVGHGAVAAHAGDGQVLDADGQAGVGQGGGSGAHGLRAVHGQLLVA